MITGLVGEGDSITYAAIGYFYGYGGVGSQVSLSGKHRAQWSFRFNPTGMVCGNRAVGGSRILTNGPSGDYPGDLNFRAADLDTLLAPTSTPRFQTGLANTRPVRKYILSVMIGTNPDQASPVTHAANVATYCLARRAAGWAAIILCTIISRTDGILANFDTAYAQPYNAIIKDNAWQATNGVTAVCDFASDSRLGATNAADNTTYFNSDKVHPKQAGYDVMTPIFTTTVNAVKATL